MEEINLISNDYCYTRLHLEIFNNLVTSPTRLIHYSKEVLKTHENYIKFIVGVRDTDSLNIPD